MGLGNRGIKGRQDKNIFELIESILELHRKLAKINKFVESKLKQVLLKNSIAASTR